MEKELQELKNKVKELTEKEELMDEILQEY